jgi:hypothetical protein
MIYCKLQEAYGEENNYQPAATYIYAIISLEQTTALRAVYCGPILLKLQTTITCLS